MFNFVHVFYVLLTRFSHRKSTSNSQLCATPVAKEMDSDAIGLCSPCMGPTQLFVSSEQQCVVR